MQKTTMAMLALLSSGCGNEYEIKNGDRNGAIVNDSGLDDPFGFDDTGGNFGEGEASVSGRICNTAGDGYVVDARVYVEALGHIYEDLTDSEGRFTLAGLPIGRHTVVVRKGSFSTTFEILLDEPDEHLQLADEECLDPDSVSIAVVTGEYDHVETILHQLGVAYVDYDATETTQYLSLLTSLEEMERYDIIFFNCGMSDAWYNGSMRDEVAENILHYVEEGNSIYVSDRAYLIFEEAFPPAIDFFGEDSVLDSTALGMNDILDAEILDPTFQKVLGRSTAELIYNLPNWVVPLSVDPSVGQALLMGDARVEVSPFQDPEPVKGVPFAARINVGEDGGRAIYTSFHNETQISVDMRALLEEIIFSL